MWEPSAHGDAERGSVWDPDDELYPAVALSRWIVDNDHTTAYAARLIDYNDGAQQVIPADAAEGSVAFRAHPSLRDWMDAAEAAELAGLLGKIIDDGPGRVVLPPRVARASFLQEYAVRWRYADVVLTLLVTALEALINIATTQRYADYAPSAHEAAFVEAAFGLASEVEVALVKTT